MHKWKQPFCTWPIAELVYYKLHNGNGFIYTTEKDEKFRVTLKLAPAAIMMIEARCRSVWQETDEVGKWNFWSVVTLYPDANRPIEGTKVGQLR